MWIDTDRNILNKANERINEVPAVQMRDKLSPKILQAVIQTKVILTLIHIICQSIHQTEWCL